MVLDVVLDVVLVVWWLLGLAWLGLVWFGLAWLGLAWLGLAWLGLVWLGLAWLGVSYVVRGPQMLTALEHTVVCDVMPLCPRCVLCVCERWHMRFDVL